MSPNDQFEETALEIATWNPRHAIEGWASAGDDRAPLFERALEIQDEWAARRARGEQP